MSNGTAIIHARSSCDCDPKAGGRRHTSDTVDANDHSIDSRSSENYEFRHEYFAKTDCQTNLETEDCLGRIS